MKLFVSFAIAVLLVTGASWVQAECMPVNSDVVSLGEKAARFYSQRSLTNAIASERERLQSVGMTSGKVASQMNCKPFPNLIGADEWRCVGEAKVCSK